MLIHKMEFRLVVLFAILGIAISQKLYFKPEAELQEEDKVNIKDKVVVCPGKKSACADGSTCCMLLSRAYGCCSLPNATCCLDGKHCCPKGTKCDTFMKACISEDKIIPWTDAQESKSEPDEKKDNSVGFAESVSSVVCPDGAHECENGQTCCPTQDGYACCSFAEAVCCPDNIHCCPKGTVCDVSHSRCLRQNEYAFLSWLGKEERPKMDKLVKNQKDRLGAVRCDNLHECPTGNTCCKLASGDWGCCPKPNAVCCDDHIHCCPHGSTCNTGAGTCQTGFEQIPWLEKKPAVEIGTVQCDDTHVCNTGSTCCRTATGDWGCCPLPQAVCCEDHVHCCPNGHTCDVSAGKCNQGNKQIDWFKKEVAIKVHDVICDATHECPSGNTCCKLVDGEWGCCPIPNAVCCDDHIHCCPDGSTCNTGAGTCQTGFEQIPWLEKKPAVEIGTVQCDDTHACNTGSTCCRTATGDWGCCPLPNAVCCEDHVHCCPNGHTCDVKEGKCNEGNKQIDWFKKEVAIKVGSVKCDATYECPSGNTCCKLVSGEWGCCPIPNAVCCSDGVHCCPEGYTCHVSAGTCSKGNKQIDWFKKEVAIKVSDVKCDAAHECPSGNTCCKLVSGEWGCCPIPNAVCCSDGVHCCPNGYTCDVSEGKCNEGNKQIDWFKKEVAIKVSDVECDAAHECPSGNTCCKLVSGEWGCCPIPNAVCCSDGVHCCPNGYTCDVSAGTCSSGNKQIDWFKKEVAIKVGNVVCDASHECPSGNTCCKLVSGEWGCCPLPQAECCSDGVHCCPNGYTCDVASGKCNQGNRQIDWFKKEVAIKVSDVKCDATHECPSGNTCCKLVSGEWGCCPLPQAECCSDGVHCCPNGYTCDVSSGKCNQGNRQIDWFKKEVAIKVGNVVCDATHECPSGNTCCKLVSGEWGCCPLPQAECCSDGVHCCPNGYTCDVASGKCNEGNRQIDWFKKEVAIKVGNVVCDATHECPSGNTCCKLVSGEWGCCPLPQADCCSDGVHCCPNGYTCDVSSGKCNQGNRQIDWFKKEVAIKVGNVVCDATHECPTGSTCCKLVSGEWGCCPLPQAVCCSDGVHCCPNGYTCDIASGKCNQGNRQIDWFKKEVAIKVNDVGCDATHECPNGKTCCKLVSGEWGYCPLPNAVCCSDGIHCCPRGTTCDVSAGKCIKGKKQIDWLEKVVAIKQDTKLKDVICPDGSECQDGQTCCRMYDSEVTSYGCCPLPNAVCCNDGQHCCPCGYKCNLGSGTCEKGYLRTAWYKTVTSISKNIQRPLQEDTIPLISIDPKGKYHQNNVPCSGTSEGCPDGDTCCVNVIGEYKCCPYEEGVCCPDHKFCCSKGYICDEEPGICRIPESTNSSWKFLNKVRAAPLR